MTKHYPDNSHHLISVHNVLVLTVDCLVVSLTEHTTNQQHRDAAAAKLYRQVAQWCTAKADEIAGSTFASIGSGDTHQ